MSYEVFRLKVRDGVRAPTAKCSGIPEGKNDDSPPSDSGRCGVCLALALLLTEDGRAPEAEADQAATAEIAVAADLDSLDALGVPKGSVGVERRGESNAERLSQVERRALETQRQSRQADSER